MTDSPAVFADLSHHQTQVNLAAYARAGHTRIVLKATEGTGFTDPAFTARWKQAGQLGLARVAYHFARAKFNGADEFDHFWAVIQDAGGLGDRDRVCLDVEDSDTPDRAAANAREFVTRAVAQGVTAGLVYTYNYYATHHAIAPSQFPAGWQQLWLADYTAGQADTAAELGAGWTRDQVVARQYTDKETVAGVAGTCDASRVLNDWLSTPDIEEDFMATVPDSEWDEVLKAARSINATAVKGTTGFEGTVEAMANKVNTLINEVRASAAITGDDEAKLGAKLDDLKADVDSLKPAGPTQPPVASAPAGSDGSPSAAEPTA
jgi:lysozyme